MMTEVLSKGKVIAPWPAERPLELVTINPSLVLGPMLARGHGTSLEISRRLLSGAMPACPRLGWPMVDVRDVAAAHIAAATAPAAAGKRYICSGEFHWVIEQAQIMAAAGHKVPSLGHSPTSALNRAARGRREPDRLAAIPIVERTKEG